MSIQYYDFEDNPISSANYKENPKRDFRKEEKYYKVGDKKTVNPDFDLQYAKDLRNEAIRAERMRHSPPLADMAEAIYLKEKGDNSKMDKYVADCDKVKADHPLV